MLKARIIPILTFNGFGLVKTKQFGNPRMVGNPVQAARVYNSRGVDELVFVDIFAKKQNRKLNYKLVSEVIKECYMPVTIGGNIQTIEDIQQLLRIGADKVLLKTQSILSPDFVKSAIDFFGSQCISIAVDVIEKKQQYWILNEYKEELKLEDFLNEMNDLRVGEFVLNAVNNDGMMNGFDIKLVNYFIDKTNIPTIIVGGGGEPEHFKELFLNSKANAVGSSSIFHFTQYTPNDIKSSLKDVGICVRI